MSPVRFGRLPCRSARAVPALACAALGCAVPSRQAERSGEAAPPVAQDSAPADGGGRRGTTAAYALSTDATRYTAQYLEGAGTYRRYGLTVVTRYRNFRQAPVALERCFPDSPTPIYGVRDASADTAGGTPRGAAYDRIWGCVGVSENLVVPAGGMRVDTLRLTGPTGWNRDGVPQGALEGEFYLTYHLAGCPPSMQCAADTAAAQRSNRFRVRLTPP